MRFLLASDVHYTVEESYEEYRKLYPNARASVASGKIFGYTQREKIQLLHKDIIAEHEKSPLDAVLFLGDLSIDDADYRNLPENFCEKFSKEVLQALPCPAYPLPGNHDSYAEREWQKAAGVPRQYAVTVENITFLMADTFAAVPAKDACGALYTGLDESFLRDAFEKHPENIFILCTHMYDEAKEPPRVKRLLAEQKNLKCIYRGHTHVAEAVANEIGKPVIDIGGYGYTGILLPDGRYDFNSFDPSWAWGYQILETDGKNITTYHVKLPRVYCGSNGTFDYPGELSPKINMDEEGW